MRQDVEGDLVRVELRLHRLAGGPLARLRVERGDAALAAARHGLVGADDDALDAGGVVDGLERHDHLDGGAVGRGDDARVGRQVVGVDLGHHERHVGVLAEHARLVDDGGAGRHGLRHELLADRAAGGEEGEVDAGERAGAELLHFQLGPLERQPAPGGARAGQQAQLADGEAALLEDARARCRRRRRWRRRWRRCSSWRPSEGAPVGLVVMDRGARRARRRRAARAPLRRRGPCR